MKQILLFFLWILPTAFLSRLFGIFSRIHFPAPLQTLIIKFYVWLYDVNLKEAQKSIGQYKSLNEFFTRALKNKSRPLAKGKDSLISPVDGVLSGMGKIHRGQLLQAKGRGYSLAELLGNSEYTKPFLGGYYLLFYLSPKDCHRIYSPLALKVFAYNYIPGRLLPVNELAVRTISKLFVRNERLISLFHCKNKIAAMVMVGASNVGSMRVPYDKHLYTNSWRSKAHSRAYKKPLSFARGAEFGRFEMGSTVILLFEKNSFKPSQSLRTPRSVQYGEMLGICAQ